MQHAENLDQETEFLPVGTRLLNGTYEITSHLGAGGFGLTYLADDQIGRKVVIKECFPVSFCVRDGLKVRAGTEAQQGNFEKLIKNFVNEARQLAKLKHPNVVPVLHFFEEHDTAYMSLEHVRGKDLATLVYEGGDDWSPEQIIEAATGMLRALDYIHSRGLLHRDIAPDNVIINETNQPVLIDFGASRNETAQAVTRLLSQQLRAVKDGYSPQEFYMPGRKHTPASDIYSFGATIYTLITGIVPEDAYTRLVNLSKKEPDPLVPLYRQVDGFPVSFLKAIDKALSLLPKDRPQSAEEMRVLMAPNSANVTPIASKPVKKREKSEGPVTPSRPAPDAKPQLSRPPAIDPDAPVSNGFRPFTDPNQPTRTVKPRVLVRSTEPERAGASSGQPVSKPRADVPERVFTDPHVDYTKTPKPAATSVTADTAAHAASSPEDTAEALPKTRVPGDMQSAPTSTFDKVLRVAALAVIAAGAFVFAEDQWGLLGSAEGAGSAAIIAEPPVTGQVATASVAPIPTAVPLPVAQATEVPAAPNAAPASTDVPTASLIPVGVQTGWGADGWAVTLDLPLVFDGSDIVFAADGASPYPAGTLLTRVAEADVGTDPAGVSTLAANYFALADPVAPRLPIAVRNPVFDSRGEAELRVDVSRVVDFGAFTLSQRPEGEGWAVNVAIASRESGLRDGDLVVFELTSATPITRISDLETVFAAQRSDGSEETVLVVERSGANQEIRVKLSDILSTQGAG